MIETAAAHDLTQRLRHVEDRLARLLVSGWRQAHAEAADLRAEADGLAEAGLTEVAARIAAVAQAGTAAEALPAVALAESACRLLRLRLQAEAVPEGWAPLAASKSRTRAGLDAVLPIARVLVDGRELWACARPARGQWLLLEPPFPPEPGQPAAPASEAPSGFFGRLRQRIEQAIDAPAAPAEPPSPWMSRMLRGRLVWQARLPFGADGRVTVCTLGEPEWAGASEDLERLQPFRQMLANNTMHSGMYVVGYSGGLRIMELSQAEQRSYAWLDQSAGDALRWAPTPKVWAIVWLEGAAVVPVALVTPVAPGSPARLTHLIPGLPSDVLATES
jgi:hypothetical protein